MEVGFERVQSSPVQSGDCIMEVGFERVQSSPVQSVDCNMELGFDRVQSSLWTAIWRQLFLNKPQLRPVLSIALRRNDGDTVCSGVVPGLKLNADASK